MSILQRKVALLGIPTDLGAPTGVLTLKAPEILRTGLSKMFDFLGIEPRDLGDINCPSRRKTNSGPPNELRYTNAIAGVAHETRDKVRDAVTALEFIFCMGGDHSTSFGTASGALAGLQEIYGEEAELGGVTVDAHFDMHTHVTSVSRNAHGTSTAAVLGHGDPRLVLQNGPAIKPENMIHIAGRELDEAEKVFAAEHGVKVFTMKDIREHGLVPVFKAIDEMRSRVHGVWANIDCDGLDASSGLTATGMYSPHGLTSAHTIDLFEYLRDVRRVRDQESEEQVEAAPLIGMEIAEFVPTKDPAHMTRNLLMEVAAMSLGGDYSPYAQSGNAAPATAELRAPSAQMQQAIIEAEARLRELIRVLEEDMQIISREFEEKRLCGARLVDDTISCLVTQMLRHRGNLKEWVHAQDSMRDASVFTLSTLYDSLPAERREEYDDARYNPYTASNSPFPKQANHLRLLELKIAALKNLMRHPKFWTNDPQFIARKRAGVIGRIGHRIADIVARVAAKLELDMGVDPNFVAQCYDPRKSR